MTRKLVVVAALMTAASTAMAGVYYEATTQVEGQRGMGDTKVKAWVDGDSAKVEFTESGNPMMGVGTYLLTKDGGKTIYLVNPSEKTYAEWDMEAMMGMAGTAMNMMRMTFTDPKVEMLGEEPGGEILGQATTHYTYRTTYGVEMHFMGTHKSTTVQNQEIWSTTSLDLPGMGIWLKNGGPKSGDEKLDAMMKAEMDKVKGFPLKQVTTSTTTSQKGKAETTTTTMEVTRLEKTSVPADTFVIPASYTETQLIPQGKEGEGEDNPLAKLFGGKGKH